MTDQPISREEAAREVLAAEYDRQVPDSIVARLLRAGEDGVVNTTIIYPAMLAFADRLAPSPAPTDAGEASERLRKALRRIADLDDTALMCDPLGSKRIARAALKSPFHG